LLDNPRAVAYSKTTKWKKLRYPKTVQPGRNHGLIAATPVTKTSNIFGERGTLFHPTSAYPHGASNYPYFSFERETKW
jgi:hypothetical protein